MNSKCNSNQNDKSIPSLNVDNKNTFNNSTLLMKHEHLSDKKCLIIEDSLCMIKLRRIYCKSNGFQNITVCLKIRKPFINIWKNMIYIKLTL